MDAHLRQHDEVHGSSTSFMIRVGITLLRPRKAWIPTFAGMTAGIGAGESKSKGPGCYTNP